MCVSLSVHPQPHGRDFTLCISKVVNALKLVTFRAACNVLGWDEAAFSRSICIRKKERNMKMMAAEKQNPLSQGKKWNERSSERMLMWLYSRNMYKLKKWGHVLFTKRATLSYRKTPQETQKMNWKRPKNVWIHVKRDGELRVVEKHGRR